MLTSERVRPSYRPYRVEVRAVQRLSDSFLRVTLTGVDLDVFAPHGLDQRIKLVLPLAGVGFSDFGIDDEESHLEGTWYTRWRDLPEAARNPIRTYTVRRIDPDARELDVDFVMHGDGGPASAWARRARVGDPLVVVGPDVRSPDSRAGIEFTPGAARRVLFAGDETAVPAISSILGSLGPEVEAHALLEIPHAGDVLPLAAHDAVTVDWLPREDREPGELLVPAVRDWWATMGGHRAASPVELAEPDLDTGILWETPLSMPVSPLYAWIAGESGVVKAIRRFLVRDCGVDRSQVAFMGYWRQGAAEGA